MNDQLYHVLSTTDQIAFGVVILARDKQYVRVHTVLRHPVVLSIWFCGEMFYVGPDQSDTTRIDAVLDNETWLDQFIIFSTNDMDEAFARAAMELI
jgi:hypothetical protein